MSVFSQSLGRTTKDNETDRLGGNGNGGCAGWRKCWSDLGLGWGGVDGGEEGSFLS